MLDELVVDNLGLIARARLQPGPGLVAITGETGAGKTLLLGALRLLRGDPARHDRIGPHGAEARVEGRFRLEDGETVAARQLGPEGSRAYLDGSMVPLRVLGQRMAGVVEIVAQHEHVALSREVALRAILDAALDRPGGRIRRDYAAAWDRRRRLQADQAAIGGDRRALERELDLALHQAHEIDAARPAPGEDARVAAQIDRWQHAADIASTLEEGRMALVDDGGVGDTLRHLGTSLQRAALFDPSLSEVARRAAGLAAEATDLAGDLRHRRESVEQDPAALEAAQQRLAALSDLKRKYGDTLDEVVAFAADAHERAGRLTALVDRADSLSAELAAAEASLAGAGTALTRARAEAGKRLAGRARRHLRDLGFRSPSLRLSVVPAAPGPGGADRAELLFSSDSSLEPGPVGRVASGGELSRLVLAVHLAAGVGEAPVVAFDEIDAGIGGETALAMGEKLAALARGRQVLVVTHLPQVAAFADAQLVVEREGSRAVVRPVEGGERVQELTRMLAGFPASERGRGHAAELLEAAGARRAAEHPPSRG